MDPMIVRLLQEIADCAYGTGAVADWSESAVDRLQHIGERATTALQAAGHDVLPAPEDTDEGESA